MSIRSNDVRKDNNVLILMADAESSFQALITYSVKWSSISADIKTFGQLERAGRISKTGWG